MAVVQYNDIGINKHYGSSYRLSHYLSPIPPSSSIPNARTSNNVAVEDSPICFRVATMFPGNYYALYRALGC
eukprot:scaffold425045_cov23-Prasinocladus_malaysianus.AAC.1